MDNKNKLLVLTSTYPRWENDSIPTFVFDLCQQLKLTFSVTVVAPHGCGTLNNQVMNGVDVWRYRYATPALEQLAYGGGILENIRHKPWLILLLPTFLLSQMLMAFKIVRQKRCSHIHAHWVLPQGLIAVLIKKLITRKIYVVVTAHGSDLLSLKGRMLHRLKAYVLNHSDHITVVSDDLQSHCINLGLDEKKISVIPMGVDIENTFVFVPKSKKKIKRIVFVGRLISQKGCAVLLQAFNLLLKERLNVDLVVVGDGPEKNKLTFMCQQLAIENWVTFRGWIAPSQVAAEFQLADMVVVPSIKKEGFGLVAVEAMACGCAVVASDYPSFRQQLGTYGAGVLVKPNDVDELASALCRLLRDEDKLKLMQGNARNVVLPRYSWKSVGEAYTHVLELGRDKQ